MLSKLSGAALSWNLFRHAGEFGMRITRLRASLVESFWGYSLMAEQEMTEWQGQTPTHTPIVYKMGPITDMSNGKNPTQGVSHGRYTQYCDIRYICRGDLMLWLFILPCNESQFIL